MGPKKVHKRGSRIYKATVTRKENLCGHAPGSGLCVPSFKTIAYVTEKKSCVCMPSVKTPTYLCNGLNTSFCTKDHKTPGYIKFKLKNLKKTNSNLGELSRGSF